jgi:PAS domain S-box-containing protein
LGLLYVLALAVVDYVTPVSMNFTLFYLLGVAFVGWGAGLRSVALLSLCSVAVITVEDRLRPLTGPEPFWAMAWNSSSRFLLFCATGWLTVRITRLNRRLGSLVEARTGQWKAEADLHKATSARLAEALDLNQKILAASPMGISAYKASGECVFANLALARIAGGTQERLLEGNFRRIGSWKKSGLLALALETLASGEPRAAEVYGTTRFGKEVWVDTRMAPFVSGGEPHLLVLSNDITERKRAEHHLRTIIERVPIILFGVDRDGLITLEDGQALASINESPSRNLGRPLVEVYGRFPAILQHKVRALAGEEFSAPVQMGSQAFDCWYTPTREEDGAVTGYVGLAINVTERHRLEQQILEITDRDQAHLGQEIHDGLCQQLVSLAFDANDLQRQLASAQRPEAATAERIARFLDQAITEARQLSRGLFPIRLETEGLCPALEELARSTRERFGIRCRFTAPEPVSISHTSTASHLYRIAQEALHNAVRHSQAKEIAIALRLGNGQLILDIADDGKGISVPKPATSGGLGLYIMNYRAHSIGGTLQVAPGPAGGTTVTCWAPRP